MSIIYSLPFGRSTMVAKSMTFSHLLAYTTDSSSSGVPKDVYLPLCRLIVRDGEIPAKLGKTLESTLQRIRDKPSSGRLVTEYILHILSIIWKWNLESFLSEHVSQVIDIVWENFSLSSLHVSRASCSTVKPLSDIHGVLLGYVRARQYHWGRKGKLLFQYKQYHIHCLWIFWLILQGQAACILLLIIRGVMWMILWESSVASSIFQHHIFASGVERWQHPLARQHTCAIAVWFMHFIQTWDFICYSGHKNAVCQFLGMKKIDVTHCIRAYSTVLVSITFFSCFFLKFWVLGQCLTVLIELGLCAISGIWCKGKQFKCLRNVHPTLILTWKYVYKSGAILPKRSRYLTFPSKMSYVTLLTCSATLLLDMCYPLLLEVWSCM